MSLTFTPLTSLALLRSIIHIDVVVVVIVYAMRERGKRDGKCDKISNQVRIPAELKHISKRRKRN